MKKITATELKSILANHKLWIDTNGKQGNFANLGGADLWSANLRGANLSCVNLRDADLYRADLYRADLTSADLTSADLTGASLEGADLRGANLYRADLRGANLTGANLTGTILDKDKKENKAEKQPEVGSVKSENLRFEIEAIAKKHGLHITCLEFKMI